MKRGKGIIKKGKEDVIKALKKFYKRVRKKKKGEILNFLEGVEKEEIKKDIQ